MEGQNPSKKASLVMVIDSPESSIMRLQNQIKSIIFEKNAINLLTEPNQIDN
jgi:hypothetical protein